MVKFERNQQRHDLAEDCLEYGVLQWIDRFKQERGQDFGAQPVQRYEDDERNYDGQSERDRTLESLVVG
jgi:hypothetical protein